jgi:hypothetical protein
MRKTRTAEQRMRRNELQRSRYDPSKKKRETPEQQRARYERKIVRLHGGSIANYKRQVRRRKAEIDGKQYAERGTLGDIAKRVEIKRLVKLLHRRVRSLQYIQRKQHHNSVEQIHLRRKAKAEQHRLKYRSDPKYNIYHRVKRNIKKHLRDGKASVNWSQRLGYTMAQLHAHLERQFIDGMSWHNMGEWHIDHIRPVASFSFNSVDDAQFSECYCLSNLRPMWGRDNMIKNAKRTHLL